MDENEFMLEDRIMKIQSTIEKHGEDKFYISFSGGKDSTALSKLIDIALPGNQIPRVFFNTGIEYNSMIKFIKECAANDPRIEIVPSKVNIKKMLEEEGYPFKSKDHANHLHMYQTGSKAASLQTYITGIGRDARFACPKVLRYQFSPDFTLNVSSKCCEKLKKKVGDNWAKEHGKTWTITGIRRAEGGQRKTARCIVFKNGHNKFNPLFPVSNEFVDYVIERYDLNLCELYYPPFNFKRTGCKGCPFAIKLQEELDQLEQFFPAERRQCEYIWGPVYDEYRRLGYRLRKDT